MVVVPDTIYLSGLFQEPLAHIRQWAISGHCGALMGLAGSGKSQLLRLLAFEPQALDPSGRTIPLFIAAKALPQRDCITLFRAMLRALYESRRHLSQSLQQQTTAAYRQILAETDLFIMQSWLRQLFQSLQSEQYRLILLIDSFDVLFESNDSVVWNTLCELRQSFPTVLSYLFAMGHEMTAGATRAKEALLSLVDVRQYWLGPIAVDEVATYLELTLPGVPCDTAARQRLYTISGGWPALIDATATIIGSQEIDIDEAVPRLLQRSAVQRRLRLIWEGLSFAERCTLYEYVGKRRQSARWHHQNDHHLRALQQKRLLNQERELISPLLNAFIREQRHTVRGPVWYNDRDDTFYQGPHPLDELSPRAEAALTFFLNHPYKKCEKDQLIYHIWNSPHITDDSIYQVIRELRKVLEPDSRNPCYIINHRSLRGGRYQFFPEGRPNYRAQ